MRVLRLRNMARSAVGIQGFEPVCGPRGRYRTAELAWSVARFPARWSRVLASCILIALADARVGGGRAWRGSTRCVSRSTVASVFGRFLLPQRSSASPNTTPAAAGSTDRVRKGSKKVRPRREKPRPFLATPRGFFRSWCWGSVTDLFTREAQATQTPIFGP